jgi:hypothetical protein
VIRLTGRRAFYVVGACIVAAAVLVAVLVTGNLAQEGMDMGMPPEMMGGPEMMGEMGGMGGMGGAAGGQPMTYEEQEPPEHLRMTYDQFLAQEGLPRVAIPEAITVDEDGKPVELSANEWHQNYRIYREGVALEVERGKPGGGLADKARAELEHIEREHEAMRELYQYACEHCFSAQISAPFLGPVRASSPDSVDIRVNVIVSSSKDFPARMERRLTPLSRPGWPIRDTSSPGGLLGAAGGRERFDFITRGGGYFKPVKLYLDGEAIGLWNQLWSETQIRVSLLDTGEKVIDDRTLDPGLDGASITQQMVFPAYAFPHRTVHRMPDISPHGTKLPMFKGAAKDMYTLKGWLIGGQDGIRFTVPVGTLATLNGVQVELVPSAQIGVGDVQLKKIPS